MLIKTILRHLKNIFIASIASFFSFISTSQTKSTNDFPFIILEAENNELLPQNQIIDILNCKNGLIISTFNGIVKYNGTDFFPFVKNPEHKKYAFDPLFLRNGSHLFGFTRGSTKRLFQITPELKEIKTFSAFSRNNDTVIGIDKNGLITSSIDYTKKSIDSLQTNIKNVSLIFSYKNHYYISEYYGYFYKVDTKTNAVTKLFDSQVVFLKKNPFKDEIYFITEKGKLFTVNKNGISYQTDLNYLHSNRNLEFIDCLFLSPHEILISSSFGLLHLKNNQLRLYNSSYHSALNSISKMYYDADNNVIIAGTANRGLIYLRPKNIKTYFLNNNQNTQSFSAIVKNNNNEIIGSASLGYVLFIKNEKYYKEEYFNCLISTISYIDDILYVGTWGEEFYKYKDGEVIETVNLNLVNGSNLQKSFIKDSEENLWIGTNKGLIKYTAKDKKYTPIRNIQGDITTILELKNGNLCVAGGEHIFILTKNGEILQIISKENGLNCKQVRALYEDSLGRLWIGTYGGGLFVFMDNQLQAVNAMRNCMLPEDIFSLIPYKGDLYISSNNGIWVISESQLFSFINKYLDYLVPTHYDKRSGLVNRELNGGFQNVYQILLSKI